MNKEVLTARVTDLLIDAGFLVSKRCYVRPKSFDLVARRDYILLILKILSNIDGLNENTAVEIRRLAKYLSGNSLLVGEKTRDHHLEQGVVYFRYGLPTVGLSTLVDWLVKEIPPFVYAAHGGLYVKIDGNLLRRLRLERGISLGALASDLGVSRRTVSKYETESMDTSIEVALRLEEIFSQELIKPVGLPEPKGMVRETEQIDNNVLQHLAQIGFDVIPTNRAPFNAITQNENLVVLTGVSKFSATMLKKARLMSNLSIVTKTHSAVIIVDGEIKMKHIEETAIIEKRELDTIDKTDEFVDLMFEKQSR
ncbi:MAG: transcriptional regulator [Methanotrichaceae archaeon]